MALLGEILGNEADASSPSPITTALTGLLGMHAAAANNGSQSGPDSLLSRGAGELGALLNGSGAGGAVSGGLQKLVERFHLNGMGEKIRSWIAKSPNQSISPGEMEQGLGPEVVQWLMRETGLGKSELLAGLCRELPQFVDRLTPNGHVPSPQEAQQHATAQQPH